MSDTKWVNLSDALAGMPGMPQGVHVTSYDWARHVAPPDGLVESVQCPDCLALVSLVDGQIRNACRCGRVWVVARAPDPVQGPVRYDFSGVRVLPKNTHSFTLRSHEPTRRQRIAARRRLRRAKHGYR